jgi:hypothetical protein
MERKLSDLPIRFYPDNTTIETAASDLAGFARERSDGRALFIADSLQTVTCNTEKLAIAVGGRELSTREAVTERSRAIRFVATTHRLIALATSEMNRSAYRDSDSAEKTDDLASAAESRAVEYSGRVVLAMRSVAREKDMIELRVAKNKHGPRGERVYLRIDRPSQLLSQVQYEPAAEDRQEAQADRRRDETMHFAGKAALVLATRPGMVQRDLEPALRNATGVGTQRVRDALDELGDAVVEVDGPRRAQYHYLDGSRVPPSVLATLKGEERNTVETARPPASEGSVPECH